MCAIQSLAWKVRTLATRASLYWRDAAERRRMAHEFARLDARDVERVLADIGCSQQDLRALIDNAPLARPLLEGMVSRLGVEAAFAAAEAGVVRDIERRCSTCAAQARCRSWLGGRGGRDDYKQFCPNAESFAAMVASRAA